jgi:hypothetical protein
MTDWTNELIYNKGILFPIIITVIVVIIIILVLFIIKILTNRKRKDMEQSKTNLKIQRIAKLEEWERSILLQDSMKKLVREHPLIENIDEAYDCINQYFKCIDLTEYNYCRDYLNKLYSKGYYRYDDERR